VLLVTESSKEVHKESNNSKLMDVHDGNTRTFAVRSVDSIQEVPCRIIKLPKGILILVVLCIFKH
jgi:hypothetical protein